MIDINSKHDNMHRNEMFYALICISKHIILCINCMLSVFAARFGGGPPYSRGIALASGGAPATEL